MVFVLLHMPGTRNDAIGGYNCIATLLASPFTLAIVFYLNYLWLVPKHFHKQNRIFFYATNLAIYGTALVFLNVWTNITCSELYAPEEQDTELVRHRQAEGKQMQLPCPPQKRIHLLYTRKSEINRINWWLFELRGIFLYTLITFLAILIHRSNRWLDAEKAKQRAEMKQAKAEVQALLSLVNPHFLLNTLNNIYALISLDTARAQQTVEKLGKMLRHMLYENLNEYTTLSKDVEFVTEYIDLMALRISEKVDIQYEVDIAGNEDMPIAPFILLPLLENAFKHGISNTDPSFIHISLSAYGKTAHCRIENSNHPQIQTDRSGNGIGLEIIQSRLDSTYPNRYSWQHGLQNNEKTYFTDLTIHIF